jgi:hypothetical protein
MTPREQELEAEISTLQKQVKALTYDLQALQRFGGEPAVKALRDRATEWLGLLFDQEVAGCTPDGKDWAPTLREKEAQQIIADLLLCVEHSEPSLTDEGPYELIDQIEKRLKVLREKWHTH